MKIIKDVHILIVGLGLIGGSYACGLKKRGFKVSAITKLQEDIDYAINEGIINYGTTKVDESLIKSADIVIFGLYPSALLNWIDEYSYLFKSGTIITDVTGVKSSIVYKIQSKLPNDVEYISAHPMAGREVSGVKNSSDAIFNDANYIVVPTENNTENAIELCKNLGEVLGFKNVAVLSPEKHDRMIGFLSQLTHCIAVSLMCANDDENLVKYTGDSFRDLTRIATINEEMWSELFLMNRDILLGEMDTFKEQFDKMYTAIKQGNREDIKDMMRLSTKRRKLFDK